VLVLDDQMPLFLYYCLLRSISETLLGTALTIDYLLELVRFSSSRFPSPSDSLRWS